jgi:hypothetical protein
VAIFILKRKAKVRGRIILLTISIKFNIGAKRPGEPWGVKCAKKWDGENSKDEDTILSHMTIDNVEVTTIWVVTPKI